MNALTSLNMSKTMSVKGKVEGRSCDILLDSGASLSVVRASLVPRETRLEKAGFSFLRVANGSCMNILGKQFGVEIGDSAATIELYVAEEMSCDCIIGVDGLKAG